VDREEGGCGEIAAEGVSEGEQVWGLKLSGFDFCDQFPEILRDDVIAVRSDGERHRICFARTHHNQPKKGQTGGRNFGTFSLPFVNSAGRLFSSETGFDLLRSNFGGYWYPIKNDQEFRKIKDWTVAQGNRVFMRDRLDASVALDFNFQDNKTEYTNLGALEARCKNQRDNAAIREIVGQVCSSIRSMSLYRGCTGITVTGYQLH
jgi:hypothetical protein